MDIVRSVVLMFLVSFQASTIWGMRHKKNENDWDMGTCPDMLSPRYRTGYALLIGVIGTRFDYCQYPRCLFIKEYDGTKLFRVCRCDGIEEAECRTDSTTHTDNREPEIGELEPYTRRTECSSTATNKPTGHAARFCICSPGLATAIPVLAMILGAVAMAFVCVFIPQLHRKATRRLNRKALENRQSQMPALIGTASPQQQDEGHYMEQLDRSALPSDDQMNSELDQRRNDIQSLERQTEGNDHLYMDMNGTLNIYNEEGYTLMHGNQTQTSNIAS